MLSTTPCGSVRSNLLRTAVVSIGSIALAAAGALAVGEPVRGTRPQSAQDEFVPDPTGLRVETWVTHLEAPWSLAFLPDGRALVSERRGRIRLIERNGTLASQPYATVPVQAAGEGGLMGLALHPHFDQQPFVYAMLTAKSRRGPVNRVVRLRHEDGRGVLEKVILDKIPAGRFHDGGRVAFGPDGLLYVTTGDATHPDLAQDKNSLAGKILRVNPDGSIAPDNPFPESPVWSYGHRNPQGLAWQPQGHVLFAPEHGPTGEFGFGAYDEVNLISKGRNYGWPLAVGATDESQWMAPLIAWPDNAVPPSGASFYRGDLYIATLASQALVRLSLTEQGNRWQVTRIERLFASGPRQGRYGRLRDVVPGPDGALYVLTSNRDGRGSPASDDDRILRITPTK